nr:predicted protein [Triticum aestivum]
MNNQLQYKRQRKTCERNDDEHDILSFFLDDMRKKIDSRFGVSSNYGQEKISLHQTNDPHRRIPKPMRAISTPSQFLFTGDSGKSAIPGSSTRLRAWRAHAERVLDLAREDMAAWRELPDVLLITVIGGGLLC